MAYPVGLVAEGFRLYLVEVAEHVVLKYLRVELGHAVGGMAADYGKVGHADLPVPEDCGLAHGLVASAAHALHFLAPSAVYLLYDHVDSGQQALHQADWPLFQGFRHYGVVGEGDGLFGYCPGIVPFHAFHVHEHPHELRHAEGGVGVVDVYGHALRQLVQRIAVGLLVVAYYGGYACRHEEVLLHQAQASAGSHGVVRIEYAVDGFYLGALFKGFAVFAAVEGVHVKGVFRKGGAPELEALHLFAAGAYYVDVVRDGPYRRVVPVRKVQVAVLYAPVHYASEVHLHAVRGNRLLPGVAVCEPRVGFRYLPAVLYPLAEEPEAVAYSHACAGNAEGRHGIQEARGKSAQTAVAQTRFRIQRQKLVELYAKLPQAVLDAVFYPCGEQVVLQQFSDEELHGEVVDALVFHGVVGLLGGLAGQVRFLVYEVYQRLVLVPGGAFRAGLGVGAVQYLFICFLEYFFIFELLEGH